MECSNAPESTYLSVQDVMALVSEVTWVAPVEFLVLLMVVTISVVSFVVVHTPAVSMMQALKALTQFFLLLSLLVLAVVLSLDTHLYMYTMLNQQLVWNL